MDVVEPPREPAAVPVERASAEPGVTGPAVPGDDPVVEREPEHRAGPGPPARSPAVARGRPRGRSRGSRRARRGTAARPPGRSGVRSRRATSRRATANGSGPAAGRLQDGDRVRGQVRPARVPPGPGALEQGQARAGRGTPRRRRSPARRRSGRAAAGDGATTQACRAGSGRRGSPPDDTAGRLARPSWDQTGAPPARDQPAATGVGFSIGTPIRLPYSVQLPS